MGKKSSAKKKKRQIQLQGSEIAEKKRGFFAKLFKKEKPKISEETKPPKKQKIKKEKKLKINKRKILGGALAVIMLSILVSVGYLLFQRAFRPESIAKFLPADRTIAFIEINSNFDHKQVIKTFKLLEKHPAYSKEKLLQLIEDKFLVDYKNDLYPWLGRQAGIAAFKSAKRDETINIIYFAEVYSQSNAENFAQKNASVSEYNGYDIYVLSDGRNTVFIDDYMFFSQDPQTIEELIDFQKSSEEKLYSESNYRKIDNNLPINKTAFIYINFGQITDNFIKLLPILSEKGLSIAHIQPFIKLFNSEGLALVALDDKFAIQSFLNLNVKNLEDSPYIIFKTKYTAELTDYVLADALAFWGGNNLENQLKRFLEILAGGKEETINTFDNFLQNYIEKYFGPEVSLENDILPLFNNEFALTIEQISGQNIYKLLIELDNPQSDTVALHEIADNFVETGAVFEPKIVEHTLEDGTVGKEIIASPEEIIKTEIQYEGSTIYEIKMGEQAWGIFYAIIDNIAVVSTHTEGVKNAVDIKNGKKLSLKSTEAFANLIEPVLGSSDEATYFNIAELAPILFDQNNIPHPIEIISSLSSGKNYFNDGITTITYLRIM